MATNVIDTAFHPESSTSPTRCAAHQLEGAQRQRLAIDILAGNGSVTELAERHQVSRKFLYQQADKGEQALTEVFSPPPPAEEKVLFYQPVTKAWLKHVVLALVLVCHSSLRGVVEFFRDVLDCPIALGSVHAILMQAVAQVRQLNAEDLSAVRAGGHDEIFQSSQPVLVGVDLDSTYCYLLAAEDQRDGETWAIHLWDLTAQGLQPDYTVADGGKGLRAGQALAWPEVPCHGDTFHAAQELGRLCQRLDNRAYAAINACDRLERMMHKAKQQHQGQRLSTALAQARQRQTQAIAVADQVRTLAQWLQEDILAFAGPEVATRQALYEFVIDALALLERCERRIQPLRQRLANQRDALLAFATLIKRSLSWQAVMQYPSRRYANCCTGTTAPPTPTPIGSRALNFSAICAGVSSPYTRSCRYWPTTSTGPVPWWKTSTAACATTFSCAVISARPAFRYCAFSSTIVLICAALSLNAAAKRRHNCSPPKPTRTGWRCSAFSAFAAWQPKHGRPFVVVTASVSA